MKTQDTKRDEAAYRYAVASQGFVGSYDDWTAQDADERAEYELGAAGIPTACWPGWTKEQIDAFIDRAIEFAN